MVGDVMVDGGLNNEYLAKKMQNVLKCSKSLRTFVKVNMAIVCITRLLQGPDCCSEYPVSLHYIKPDIMRLLDYMVSDTAFRRLAPRLLHQLKLGRSGGELKWGSAEPRKLRFNGSSLTPAHSRVDCLNAIQAGYRRPTLGTPPVLVPMYLTRRETSQPMLQRGGGGGGESETLVAL